MKTQKILERQYFSLKSETTEWKRCEATGLMGFCFPVAVTLINGDEA